MIGTGIGDGTGDWVCDCDDAVDHTGIGTVGTGLGIGVRTVGSGTVSAGYDVEDTGMEISSLSPKSELNFLCYYLVLCRSHSGTL
jgi:hypothetical protein